MRWWAGAGTAAALLATASPVAGQQLSVRVGGVRAQYADTVAGTAAALTARAAFFSPFLSGLVDGTFTQFTSGSWAAQLGGGFSGVRLVAPRFGLGWDAIADGGYLEDGTWSGTVSAGPFGAVVRGPWMLSAGVTGGAVRRVNQTSDLTAGAHGDIRLVEGPWSADAGVAYLRAGPLGFADGTLGAELSIASVTLGALAGARAGNLGGKPWLQGRGAWYVARWATLEAVVGSYPPDVSGFTGGVYVSVGVWLGRPTRSGTALAHTAGPPGSLGGAGASSVTMDSVGPARSVVTFAVPGASSVAIAGEWNNWTPTALERRPDGRWRAALPLGPGTYRFSLVVDSRRWIVPPGVPTLPDGFGGSAGVLIVEASHD